MKKKIVSKKRIKAPEQVRDRLETSGFGDKGYYKPLSKLSPAQIRDILIANSWVDVCVNTIVDEVIKYPLASSPINDDIEALLKYPSETEPLFTIRKKYLKDMLRYGNGCCVLVYKNGKPVGLRVVPGYLLRVTADEPPKYKFLELDKETFLKNGKTGKDMEFSGKEVMHFQIDADSDSTIARSPLEKIYDDLSSDKNINKSLVKFSSKGFYLPSFFSIEKINKGDLSEFVEFVSSIYGEGGKIGGINKKAELTNVPCWTADDIIRMQRWIGLKVANAFKVPPFMLNLIEDTGSLNAREQRQRFLENVILPIVEYETYIYTMVLAIKGFEKKDVSIASTLAGTKLSYDKAKTAKLLNKGDILTVDEIRHSFFNLQPITKTTKK